MLSIASRNCFVPLFIILTPLIELSNCNDIMCTKILNEVEGPPVLGSNYSYNILSICSAEG